MTPTATAQPIETLNLAALERDARKRLAELRDQRQRMSPEALVDDRVRSELDDVESQIRAAEAELRRIELAGTEHDRRAQQERTDGEQARRDGHMAEARRLQPEIEKAIATFDRELGKAMAALRRYHDLSIAQLQQLGAAGQRPQHPGAWVVNAAVKYHLQRADIPPGVVEIGGDVRARAEPLADSHPRPNLEEDE